MLPAASSRRGGLPTVARRAKAGFTVLELILVIAIFAIAVASVLPFLAKFQQTQTLSTVHENIVQSLRRAQHRAVIGERDSAWGVRFLSGSYVLYAGNSYAGRTTGLDERHTVAAVYSFAGRTEITFRKLGGSAMTGGTLTINGGAGGVKTIQVNSVGKISTP